MQAFAFTPANAISSGFAATVPAFLMLSLNGTTLFYGMDTVAAMSLAVGFSVFLASLFAKTSR